MQLVPKNPQQFAGRLIAKSVKVAYAHDRSTLNDVFTESVDVFVRLSLRDYWVPRPHAELINITFHANYLLAIQNCSLNDSYSIKIYNLAKPYQKKLWQRAAANNMNTGAKSCPAYDTRNRSRPPPVLHIDSYISRTTAPSASPTSSSSMPSMSPPKCYISWNVAHLTSACPLFLEILAYRTQWFVIITKNCPRMQASVTMTNVSSTTQDGHK